jgi:hypothetical protein
LELPVKVSKAEHFAWERQFAKDLWGRDKGFIKAKSLYGGRIDLYLSKYMTKDIDKRLFSHRKFLYSKNCLRPVILTDFNSLDIVNIVYKYLNKFYKLIYNKHIVNEFLEINYYQYEKLRL